MPTIRLAFTSAPRYVRTARLVGVAMARRAGVADELLDEVRQAVGEACGRAVARHQRHGVKDLIRVELDDDGPYVVRVIDACGAAPCPGSLGSGADEDADADRMADTLLAGLVQDLRIQSGPEGTEVTMVWPVQRRPANSRH
jgi:anti-sigma regulatory factor (Ser/Thr protein kinase)